MSEKETPKLSPEAERDAMVSLAVGNCVSKGYDEICTYLDRLHERGITDAEIVASLREQHEMDLLDWYAEWAGIDIREDDNTTLNPVVPDPGEASSYSGLTPNLEAYRTSVQAEAVRDAASPSLSTPALDRFIQHARGEVNPLDNGLFYAELDSDSGRYYIYKRRANEGGGAFVTTVGTDGDAARIIASLGTGVPS